MNAEKTRNYTFLYRLEGRDVFATALQTYGPKCVAAVPATTTSDTLFVFSFPEADVTSRAERPVLSPERNVLKMRHELTTRWPSLSALVPHSVKKNSGFNILASQATLVRILFTTTSILRGKGLQADLISPTSAAK